MTSDLIVNSPFASRHPTSGGLIAENIPQSIRALRAAPGFLKIDCLLNARPGLLQTCTGRGGVEVQNCRSLEGTKEMLH
jgi:hypothetical protein